VRRALEVLPNTTKLFPSRADWINVGIALHAALPDDPALALELFQQWSAKWEGGNDPGMVEAEFRSFKPPHAIGAQYLYALAEKHSGGAFRMADVFFDDLEDVCPCQEDRPENISSATPPKYEYLSLGEAASLARTHSSKPLVKGLLDQGALSVLYGASNTGKTFASLDMAVSQSAGLPWAEMKTAGLPTVYIATEGGGGILKRIAALEQKYGRLDDIPFRLLRASVNLLDAKADLRPLIASLICLRRELGGLGMIVIDTLARALGSGDENRSTDMGAFIENVDEIRKATGAHILLVHHTGKDAANGARGWSGLRGAIDTELELTENLITATKQRDLDKNLCLSFDLRSVELWRDEDGKHVTSALVEIRPNTGQATGVPTNAEADVLEAIETLEDTMSAGKRGVSAQDVLEWLSVRPGNTETNLNKIRGYIRALVE
jgi:hypothetical protein